MPRHRNALLPLLLAVAVGCTKPRTELVVTVRSELSWGDGGDLHSLRLVVRRDGATGAERVLRHASLGTATGQWTLPLSFGLVPQDSENAGRVWIEVAGCATGDASMCDVGRALVVQRALVGYRVEQTETLDLWLGARCRGVTCGVNDRCNIMSGACEPAKRAGVDVTPWQGGVVPGDVATDVAIDDATIDAAPDVVVVEDTVVPDSGACPAGRTRCGTVCVTLGACTSAGSGGCEATGTQRCVGGSVVCGAEPRTSGACSSPAGGVCGGGGVCGCAGGQVNCGGTCVDTRTSAAHCGACGRACETGESCRSGTCALYQRSCETAGTPGCGLVRVTGGTFTMGEGSPAFQASPVQPNTTVGNFALDAYEVTVARFRRWVAAGRPVPSGPVMYRGGAVPFEGTVNTDPELDCEGSYSNYPRMDRENHPMNCVNWATAQAFCVWDGGRLPTQAEWEFAARGPSGRIYPWGSVGPDDTLTCWSRSEMLRTSTCPVGMFTAGSVGGIHDLAGNVWEWNADWFAGYTTSGMGCWIGASTTNAVCNNRATGLRVIRGGSWGANVAEDFRSASRGSNSPANRYDNVGFRCARDTP